MSKPPQSPYPPDLQDDARPRPDFADLVDVVVADLDWANRRSLKFSARRVEFQRCRLTGAELAEASLSDVTFVECRLDLVGLRHAKLERVVFRGCRMSECDLYGATLRDVLLERCWDRDPRLAEGGSSERQRLRRRPGDIDQRLHREERAHGDDQAKRHADSEHDLPRR
jgi:uncharacterized protein YjbI with pentapeptide repeats